MISILLSIFNFIKQAKYPSQLVEHWNTVQPHRWLQTTWFDHNHTLYTFDDKNVWLEQILYSFLTNVPARQDFNGLDVNCNIDDVYQVFLGIRWELLTTNLLSEICK